MIKKILLFISLMGVLGLCFLNGYNIPIVVSDVLVAGNYAYGADVYNGFISLIIIISCEAIFIAYDSRTSLQ